MAAEMQDPRLADRRCGDEMGVRANPTLEYTPWAPPESAVLTERRKGKAKSIVFAAAGAICALVPAERAIPGAIRSLGMLEDAI